MFNMSTVIDLSSLIIGNRKYKWAKISLRKVYLPLSLNNSLVRTFAYQMQCCESLQTKESGTRSGHWGRSVYIVGDHGQ